MSTDTQPLKTQDKIEVEYVPLGENEPIKLNAKLVELYLMTPTKKGVRPTPADVFKFMMLCKARELNPWVGDAYCVGYDQDDGAIFNLITSVQALFKRADGHPQYDGIESGIIVKTGEGQFEQRTGDWFCDGEVLLGGWAKVYRKDRKHPFEERIKLATFNKGLSLWKKDPEGMISKCAEAGALRKAFPTQLGSLYLREEMEAMVVRGDSDNPSTGAPTSGKSLLDKMQSANERAQSSQQSRLEERPPLTPFESWRVSIETCNQPEKSIEFEADISSDQSIDDTQRGELLTILKNRFKRTLS